MTPTITSTTQTTRPLADRGSVIVRSILIFLALVLIAFVMRWAAGDRATAPTLAAATIDQTVIELCSTQAQAIAGIPCYTFTVDGTTITDQAGRAFVCAQLPVNLSEMDYCEYRGR